MSMSVLADPWREPQSSEPHPSGDGNPEGNAKGPSRKQRRRKSGPMTPGRFSGGQQSNAGRGLENGAHHSDEEWCDLLLPEPTVAELAISSPTSIPKITNRVGPPLDRRPENAVRASLKQFLRTQGGLQ
jgi:hypothetical protein